MAEPPGREPMTYRASDMDREQTAEVLRRAAGDGRISLDELDNRLAAAYGAATYAELAKVTEDLPPTGAVVPAGDDKPLVFGGQGGKVQRRKRWKVPRRIEYNKTYGSLVLDFRSAMFTSPVTEVDIDSTYGRVLLILPDNASATVDVASEWGRVNSTVQEHARDGTPHVHVTGKTGFGRVRVRHARGRLFRRR